MSLVCNFAHKCIGIRKTSKCKRKIGLKFYAHLNLAESSELEIFSLGSFLKLKCFFVTPWWRFLAGSSAQYSVLIIKRHINRTLSIQAYQTFDENKKRTVKIESFYRNLYLLFGNSTKEMDEVSLNVLRKNDRVKKSKWSVLIKRSTIFVLKFYQSCLSNIRWTDEKKLCFFIYLVQR